MKTIEDYDNQEQESGASSAGIGFADVIRMLFKHKWTLISFVLLGIFGAVAMYINHTPHYESTSKIFVRYVEEVSNVDASEGGRGRGGNTVESVIGAEVEILQSWDLAKEVVDSIGATVIAPNSTNTTRDLAAQVFLKMLEVAAPKGGRVITVTYRHPDPDVAVKALSALVSLYQKKHVEIHRATKSRETSRSRQSALTGRISELGERIEQLKAENGISSLVEAANGLNKRSDELRGQLAAAEADLQEQNAKMEALTRLGMSGKPDQNSTAVVPAQPSGPGADRAAFLEYETVMKRLAVLQEQQHLLKERYAPGSQELKQNRADFAAMDARREQIEKLHPIVLSKGPDITPGTPLPATLDPTLEGIRLATLTARVQLLRKRNDAMKDEFKQFSTVSKRLHEMERDRDLQTEGLKQFAGTFQRTEFESPLTADQYDNIVVVQSSSPPVLALSKLYKLMAGICFGLSAIGLGLVVLLELIVNRSVKRPSELETAVGIPLMCYIPRISHRDRKALRNTAKKPEGELLGVEAWSSNHFIRPFAETVRDRLVLHFEQVGLTRKPKLVAVSSYSRGAGVTTIASGIASALSQTGDGKVLLVDMNIARGAIHPFFEGKPAASLSEALDKGRKIESAAENLYLATASMPAENARAQLFPKRFYDLIPTFQASDFDYIIFDMPPMDESSLTLAMSGFLDKILLVVEGEKDNRDTVRRVSGELLRARAKLSGILNKTRSYGPKWLQEA